MGGDNSASVGIGASGVHEGACAINEDACVVNSETCAVNENACAIHEDGRADRRSAACSLARVGGVGGGFMSRTSSPSASSWSPPLPESRSSQVLVAAGTPIGSLQHRTVRTPSAAHISICSMAAAATALFDCADARVDLLKSDVLVGVSERCEGSGEGGDSGRTSCLTRLQPIPQQPNSTASTAWASMGGGLGFGKSCALHVHPLEPDESRHFIGTENSA